MKHLEPATQRMAFRPASAGPGGTGGTAESRARPGPPESESAADMLPRAGHAPRCPRHATRGLWPANTKGGIMLVACWNGSDFSRLHLGGAFLTSFSNNEL